MNTPVLRGKRRLLPYRAERSSRPFSTPRCATRELRQRGRSAGTHARRMGRMTSAVPETALPESNGRLKRAGSSTRRRSRFALNANATSLCAQEATDGFVVFQQRVLMRLYHGLKPFPSHGVPRRSAGHKVLMPKGCL